MLLGCTKFRIEELLKLKKSDLKDKIFMYYLRIFGLNN